VAFPLLLALLTPFSWHGFWSLWRQSLIGLYAWPPALWVTLVLAVNLVAALAVRWPFQNERWQQEYWLAFASLVFIPATIAIGDIGWIDSTIKPRPSPSAMLLWINNGMLIACILLGIFWVYRMKRLRWFALALMMAQVWLLVWASLAAGVALTGNWV